VIRRSGACVAALLALLAVPVARADDVSRETLARLAERAIEDERALERLERVDSVDGLPVDLGRALAGAEGAELDDRLEALAEPAASGTVPRAEPARDEARAILAERRFHRTELPRPFAGLLHWIGERLRPVVDAVGWVADRFPGGSDALWAVAGAAVAAVAALVALRLARRRSGGPVRARAERGAAAAGPGALERLADEAEQRGDHETALRLRFRAGLLRLDRLRVLPFRESLTSGEVARRLRSPEFDRLARSFDEVVYGRRPPRREDAEEAREGWRRVLAEATPR
jgi:hypothetical protein